MATPNDNKLYFPPNPARERIERWLGALIALLGIAVGKVGYSSLMLLAAAIGLLLTGLCLIAVADTRRFGPPTGNVSQPSLRAGLSYPLVWVAALIRALFGKNP